MGLIVKVCRVHGDLTIENTKKNGNRIKCRLCCNENERNRYHKILTSGEIDEKLKFKSCKLHGKLTRENTIINGSIITCHQCSLEHNRKNYDRHKDKYKETFINTRRESVNESLKQKRLENIDEYREYGRDKYHRNREKETIRTIARRRGVTYEYLVSLYEKQNNKCAICGGEETRRTCADSNEVTLLCYDHNHKTGKNRELLCHACNTMIGKAKEDINILQKAIQYLQKHQKVE